MPTHDYPRETILKDGRAVMLRLLSAGDFDKLQDMLGRVGGELAIEWSVAAGAQP